MGGSEEGALVTPIGGHAAAGVEATCTIRLFGAMTVEVDARTIDLGPPKQRALLAILVLHAGEILPTDRLVELLWDGDPPRTAHHSVQIYVSDLRKAFAGSASAPTIETRQPGYRLLLGGATVDVVRFADMVRSGITAAQAGRATNAVATFREALAIAQGEPLADFAYADFAQVEIERLITRRRDAMEALAAAALACGDAHTAVVQAERVVADDPLRERPVELLMTALYRAGRHAQALRAYQQHRQHLGEELCVVPSPRLDRLYERILLHDETLMPAGAGHPSRPVDTAVTAIRPALRNPYKGLRPFAEGDASDFFGRDELVARLIDRLRSGERFLALVGPSGSGKSSVVAAGMVPLIRAGVIAGSQHWAVVSVIPGSHPSQEVEAALARAHAPGEIAHDRVLSLTAARRNADVVLILDQFEGLFLAADESAVRRFLDELVEALSDPNSRLRVVITLRADRYDHPLRHAAFADLFTAGVVNVLPLTPAELTSAVVRPAEGVGVAVQPELAAEVVADTIIQPGSLPLLQYALTEQFDRSTSTTLTLADYSALGGVRAVLSQSADRVFHSLGDDEQRITKLLLLRMVRVGAGGSVACRRIALAELMELDLDPVGLSEVLAVLVRHRLLALAADPATGRPTVGVAHDALLVEWGLLAGWVERHRSALRRHDTLRAAATEWDDAGRHADYLLTGVRLTEVESWPAEGVRGLASVERAFIDESLAKRRLDRDTDVARTEAERRTARRGNRRLLLLGAVAIVAIVGVASIVTGDSPPARVTLFYHDYGEVSDLVEAGFDRAVAEFGFRSQEIDSTAIDGASLLDDVADGQQFVIDFTLETDVDAVARGHPNTHFLVIDGPAAEPNVTPLLFAVEEGSFLAGAAAALTSTTGTVGFIGGVDIESVWQFQAGFEAGARAVDPGVRILTTYLARPPDYDSGFLAPAAGERAAQGQYQAGADVVFAAAGTSGLGVFEAAAEMSRPGRHLWAIGVDSDQFVSVRDLPGTVSPADWTPHILTSVTKHFDEAVYTALAAYASDGQPPPSTPLGLEAGGVDISYSGGFIDALRPQIDELRRAIIRGEIIVPCRPEDRPLQPGEVSACT